MVLFYYFYLFMESCFIHQINFHFTSLIIVMITALKSLFANSNIWVISGSVSIDCYFCWGIWGILDCILDIGKVVLYRLLIWLCSSKKCWPFCFSRQLFDWIKTEYCLLASSSNLRLVHLSLAEQNLGFPLSGYLL